MIPCRSLLSLRGPCRRFVTHFSGRLDGSTDGEAPSRTHFETIKHDPKKLFNLEEFLVSAGNEHGFIINQTHVMGSVLVLPYMGFLHWQCSDIQSASPDSLFLISRIFPKVSLLTTIIPIFTALT
jgi:hypothetical protein